MWFPMASDQHQRVRNRERPRPRLRRFEPRTVLPGRARAVLALVLVLATYPISGLIGSQSTASIVAAAICALGVAIGVWARDSRGRALAWAAIILGLVLLYVYLFSAAVGPHLEGPETESLRGPGY